MRNSWWGPRLLIPGVKPVFPQKEEHPTEDGTPGLPIGQGALPIRYGGVHSEIAKNAPPPLIRFAFAKANQNGGGSRISRGIRFGLPEGRPRLALNSP